MSDESSKANHYLYDLGEAMVQLEDTEKKFAEIKDDILRIRAEISRVSKLLRPALEAAGDAYVIPVSTSRGQVHLKWDACEVDPITRVKVLHPYQVEFPGSTPDIQAGDTVYRDPETGNFTIIDGRRAL